MADRYRKVRRAQRIAGDAIEVKIVCRPPSAFAGDYETWARSVQAVVNLGNGRNVARRLPVDQKREVQLLIMEQAERAGHSRRPEIIVRAFHPNGPQLMGFGYAKTSMAPTERVVATVPLRLKIVEVIHL